MTTTPPDFSLTPELHHQIARAATVVTAADLPQESLRNGHSVGEVNSADNEFVSPAATSLRGRRGATLERLLDSVVARPGGSA